MSVSSSRKITQILGAELDKLVTLPLIWLTLIGTFILNLVLAAAFTSAGLQGAARFDGRSGYQSDDDDRRRCRQ